MIGAALELYLYAVLKAIIRHSNDEHGVVHLVVALGISGIIELTVGELTPHDWGKSLEVPIPVFDSESMNNKRTVRDDVVILSWREVCIGNGEVRVRDVIPLKVGVCFEELYDDFVEGNVDATRPVRERIGVVKNSGVTPEQKVDVGDD